MYTEPRRVVLRMFNQQLIRSIRLRAEKLKGLSDAELRKSSLALKYRAQIGEKSRSLLAECFSLVVEAARRCLGQVHYDVQLLCGIQMTKGRIAEMKTGEGKTLTSSLVNYYLALRGQGLHVVTFNDYLAERDCDFLRPLYELLGLNASVLKEKIPPEQKRESYRADITYGSAKEFGFDFLRDRLALADGRSAVMRGTHYAVIDEADSILIDEARTPLIIGMRNSAEEQTVAQCYAWASHHANRFEENNDYKYDEQKQSVQLTNQGIHKLRGLPQNEGTTKVSIRELYDHMQNAIKVSRDFQLDKHYAVIDGEIVILDEFTGRPATGRQWQKGIHQAVESKEGLKLSPQTRSAATITIQSYFSRYDFFCGMTGTAWTSRREFKNVYKKRVARVPTNLPIDRARYPVNIFKDFEAKCEFIAERSQEFIANSRAILIGTRSVEKSEFLSSVLSSHGIVHDVLNAKNLEQEAEIVSAAGQPKRVTVATNMAGRGTDIKLHEDVREAGGLHVFLTEIHEAERIDWQLIGRAARQGDPGSFQICLSLDDEILHLGLGMKKALQIRRKYQTVGSNSRELYALFRKAQRMTEKRHLTDRMVLLKQDVERRKASFDTGQDPHLSAVR